MLTPSQQRAIASLIRSPDRRQAAIDANVSERTLRNYFRNTEFLEEYQKAQDILLKDAIAQLKSLLSKAIGTLEEVMSNPDSPDFARISAARTSLEYCIKLHEQVDVLERIQKLEGSLNDKTD